MAEYNTIVYEVERGWARLTSSGTAEPGLKAPGSVAKTAA